MGLILAAVGGAAVFLLLGCGGLAVVGWLALTTTRKPASPPVIAQIPPLNPGNNPPIAQPPLQPPQGPIGPGPLPGGPLQPGGGEPPPRPRVSPVVLTPPKAVFALRPAPFTGETRTVNLPAPMQDLVVGGGGRFLLLYLAREHKVAVFDVTVATVVKYVPVPDDARIAAGMDVLLVASPSAGTLQRWSLRTFEKEATFPLPTASVTSLCLGSASNGPLLLDTNGNGGGLPGPGPRTLFVDPSTGKTLTYEQEGGQNTTLMTGSPVRAAANGSAFAARSAWQGGECLAVSSTGVKLYNNHDVPTHMAWPSPDGRFVCTDSAICNREMQTVLKPANPGGFITSPFLPAVEGGLFLHLDDHTFRNITNPGAPKGREGATDLEFYLPGETSPFTIWKDFDGVPGSKLYTVATGLTTDKRYLLIPQARVLITVPASDDRLVLRRFDLDALLKDSSDPYLLVASTPPPAAARGALFSYQLDVKSKKGGVQVKLESGPPGMRATPSGMVRWQVPADFADREVDVLLSVADDSGKSVFHAFRLSVVDAKDLPTVIPAPEEPAVAVPPAEEKAPAAEKPARQPQPVAFKPYVPKMDREEVKLPAAVGDVAVGGNGRYLVLRLADRQQLVVFDVQQGKVVKELPLADEVAHFAAGADRLVVLYPNAQQVQIWSLTTFEKERQAPLPGSLTHDEIRQVVMGSASGGPVFVTLPKEKRTLALDLANLNTTEVNWKNWGANNAYGPLFMSVSPDGTVLLGWSGGWAGLDMVLFKGGQQVDEKADFEFSMGLFALPSADDRLIFTPWAIVNRDTLAAAKVPQLRGAYLVPAREPGYFLALSGAAGDQGFFPGTDDKHPALPSATGAAVWTDERKRLFALDDADELKAGNDLPWEKRVHYYPTAGLLLTLAADKQRLVLRHVDLTERLTKSGVDYLFVTSQPPTARPGTRYSYRLDVRSKKGGVKVNLDSGPGGLRVTPEGLVTWAVPANFGEPEVDVTLTISDASGQEIFHRFKVAVADR